MALIKRGDINDFAVSAKKTLIENKPFLKNINRFNALSEIARTIEPNSFELIKSDEPRGLALKAIELIKGFEGFLGDVFHQNNEVYFIVYAWDLSGNPVYFYPGISSNINDVRFNIREGKIKKFIGEGINLFPKQQVVGGISVRIQLWESDQKDRDFGQMLSQISSTIKDSKLNNLISGISLLTGISGVTITLIKEAILELSYLTGEILKNNTDDFVDYYEGYYAADQIWIMGDDSYEESSSIITLNKY